MKSELDEKARVVINQLCLVDNMHKAVEMVKSLPENIKFRSLEMPEFPEEVLNILASEADLRTRGVIARRKRLPSNVIRQLAKDKSIFIQKVIAGRDDLPYDVIGDLGRHPNPIIRAKIAEMEELSDQVTLPPMVEPDRSLIIEKALSSRSRIMIFKLLAKKGKRSISYITRTCNLDFDDCRKDLDFFKKSKIVDEQQAGQPMFHLRTQNPYVMSLRQVFNSWETKKKSPPLEDILFPKERIAILRNLVESALKGEGMMYLLHIARVVELDQETCQRHLDFLRDAGIVREGEWYSLKLYSLDIPDFYQLFYLDF